MVPYRGSYLVWHCNERPDVVFEDVVEVGISRETGSYQVPSEFMECIEPGSLRVVSLLTNGGPARVAHSIEGDAIHLRTVEPLWQRIWFGIAGARVRSVTVRIEGIRRGFAGVRYKGATRAEYEANERFYRMQRWGVAKK